MCSSFSLKQRFTLRMITSSDALPLSYRNTRNFFFRECLCQSLKKYHSHLFTRLNIYHHISSFKDLLVLNIDDHSCHPSLQENLAPLDSGNAARRLLDNVSYVTEAVSSLSIPPSRMLTNWITDQVAPDYWIPNSEITVSIKSSRTTLR